MRTYWLRSLFFGGKNLVSFSCFRQKHSIDFIAHRITADNNFLCRANSLRVRLISGRIESIVTVSSCKIKRGKRINSTSSGKWNRELYEWPWWGIAGFVSIVSNLVVSCLSIMPGFTSICKIFIREPAQKIRLRFYVKSALKNESLMTSTTEKE